MAWERTRLWTCGLPAFRRAPGTSLDASIPDLSLRSLAPLFFEGARFSWSALRAHLCATLSDLWRASAATAFMANAGFGRRRVHADATAVPAVFRSLLGSCFGCVAARLEIAGDAPLEHHIHAAIL